MAQKGYSKAEARAGPRLARRKQSDRRKVRSAGFFHSENQAYELFGCMGNGDIVMLALGPLKLESQRQTYLVAL